MNKITPDALKILERLLRTDGHRFPAALMNAVTSALMTGECQPVTRFFGDPEFDRAFFSERPPFVFGKVGILLCRSGDPISVCGGPREYDDLIRYLDTHDPHPQTTYP